MDTSLNGSNGGDYAALEEGSSNPQVNSSKAIKSVDAYNTSFTVKSGRFATGFLICYFVISIVVSDVWFGFKPLDAIYFSVVTFSTGLSCVEVGKNR